eukprot:COSAG01_NODE_6929_length_3435_cov_75.040767_5_plen_140_part_00
MLLLLQRLYDVQEGKVCFAGRDVRALEPRWLRQQLGVVAQEPVLFSGTVSENISYGFSEPQELQDSLSRSSRRSVRSSAESQRVSEGIRAAAAQACALDFIEELPQGFDSQLGERGVMLSGASHFGPVAAAAAVLMECA